MTTLVAELRERYPDVSESSIRTYLGTLEFVQQKGVVRRRTESDGWRAALPLNTVRGVFRNGPNEIRVVHPVTTEALRGSGQAIHEAVGDAAGVRPGGQRTFTVRTARSRSTGSSHQPPVPPSAHCALTLWPPGPQPVTRWSWCSSSATRHSRWSGSGPTTPPRSGYASWSATPFALRPRHSRQP